MRTDKQALNYIDLFQECIDINQIGVADACSAMMAIVIPTLVANHILKEEFLYTVSAIFDALKKKQEME